MKNTISKLYVAAVLTNIVVILIYVTKYYPYYREIRGPGLVQKGINRKWIPQAEPRYNFDKHAEYRLEVLKTEMDRLAHIDYCTEVMTAPSLFWRSQPFLSTNFTADIDWARLKRANKCSVIPIPEFIKTPPKPNQYSFELPFLEDPPVTNILRVSNETTSSVVLLNSSSKFYIGDTVALLITMRDGEGKQKSKGGDEIRVWFTDKSNHQSVLPAKVTDLHNGTYVATAVLAFVGNFRTTVTLVYSREYIQTLVIGHLMIKSTTIYIGAFKNLHANETTVCSHIPVIPGVGQSEVCNVTSFNGSPWFCGRPVKPWLDCTDYVHTAMLPLAMELPMNEAEKMLMNRENKISPITGSTNIELQVLARTNVKQLLSSKACNTIPARRTWEQSEPTGYLHNRVWHSYLCSKPETVTKYCLFDLEMHLLGDSNLRSHYGHVTSRSYCKQQILQEYVAWHKPLKCVNNEIHFIISWLPHSNPFKANEKSWAGIDWLTASNVAIDQIPSTGVHVIYLNHYLHVTSSHISAYIDMMTPIKDALVRLFQRNPNVIVVLQGPHIVWWFGNRMSYHMGDTLLSFFIAIQYELFSDLRDRVFYIQTTDMTIATQNSVTHPHINPQISNYITGFFCGRH